MQRSKNETVSMLTKALAASWREKQANPGTQTEFGEALFLLETYGFDAVSLLEELVEATQPSPAPHQFKDDMEISDLANTGPAIMDFSVAEAMPFQFYLANGASPLIFAALSATYGAVVPVVSTFYLGEEREVIAPFDYILERQNLDNIAAYPAPCMVLIEPGFSEGEPLVKAEGPVEVDDARWQKLAAMAAKLMVPASEESRLKGAGAGLNDND